LRERTRPGLAIGYSVVLSFTKADDVVLLPCGGVARLLLERHSQAQNRQPILPEPDLPQLP
jgi:hypothetical protein